MINHRLVDVNAVKQIKNVRPTGSIYTFFRIVTLGSNIVHRGLPRVATVLVGIGEQHLQRHHQRIFGKRTERFTYAINDHTIFPSVIITEHCDLRSSACEQTTFDAVNECTELRSFAASYHGL